MPYAENSIMKDSILLKKHRITKLLIIKTSGIC